MADPSILDSNDPEDKTGDREQDGSELEEQDLRDYLTPDLQRLLDKDLQIIDRERSQEVALLKKGLATEGRFVKDWGFPTDCSYEGCGHDIVTDAKCWLEKQRHDLEEQIGDLTKDKEEKQNEVDKQLGDIAALEESLTSLIDGWKAFPSTVKEAWDKVQDLKEKLKQPNLGSIRKEMLEAELTAAKARLKDLCGSEDLEKPEDCKPAPEKLPHQAISATLERWRQQRSRLREIVAVPKKGSSQDSLEDIEVKIKKAQKRLEYTKTFEETLIAMRAKYLFDKLPEEERRKLAEIGEPCGCQSLGAPS